MANLQAITIGQRSNPYIASPAGSGPQMAQTASSWGGAAAAAQPQLITFSWGVLATAAALLVLYFEVIK